MGKQKSNQIRSSIRDNNSVAAATYFKFSDIILCAHATPAWKASKNLWTTSLPHIATTTNNNNNKEDMSYVPSLCERRKGTSVLFYCYIYKS